MTRPRITGIGAVSAFGMGAAALCRGLAGARPALSPLPFPAADFPHNEGGVAPPRSELAALLTRRKDLKLMSPDALLAVAAGVLAWQDASLPDAALDPEEVGLFLAVGGEKGEVTDLAPGVAVSLREGQLDPVLLAGRGLDRIHPLDSLKTLPNMALAHVAIRLGLRGPALTFSGTAEAAHQALAEARAAVAEGRCRVALAGGAESLVSFAGYVQAWRDGLFAAGAFPGEGAAVLVIEAEDLAASRGAAPYGEPDGWPDASPFEALAGRCGVASAPLALAAACASMGRVQ